jgi:hypothetical protein
MRIRAGDRANQPEAIDYLVCPAGLPARSQELISIKAVHDGGGMISNKGGTDMSDLPYLRTMFATCMLFQVVYTLCVLLWLAFPQLAGHALLPAIFPSFTFLTIGSFIYGLIASMIYGWIAAIIFVFFYNLWPAVAAAVFGRRLAMR